MGGISEVRAIADGQEDVRGGLDADSRHGHQDLGKRELVEHLLNLAGGGLYIIGTERHESRRIDNQLRGRAGRQGDPGRSRFYLSLEDDLMRLFGGERMTKVFAALGVDEDVEIQHNLLSNAIESAQKRVEGRNFSIRKHVLEYDDVMNKQREIIYAQRRKVLEGDDLHVNFRKMIEEVMKETLLDFCAGLANSAEWDTVAIDAKVRDIFGDLDGLGRLSKARQGIDAEEFNELLTEQALEKFESRAQELGSADLMREAERVILLRTVDSHWMDHIDAMDDLRDSIGMRGYAQHDPVIEYKKEGFSMFESMNQVIREDSVRLIMRARFNTEQAMQRKSVAKNITEGHGGSGYTGQADSQASVLPSVNTGRQQINRPAGAGPQQPQRREEAKVGRNEPCPCGSGKKYKNCHGKNE